MKIQVFISSEIPYVYWNEEELEDKDSKTRPQLKCLIDGEYSIWLGTDEPDSTFVCQLFILNI